MGLRVKSFDFDIISATNGGKGTSQVIKDAMLDLMPETAATSPDRMNAVLANMQRPVKNSQDIVLETPTRPQDGLPLVSGSGPLKLT